MEKKTYIFIDCEYVYTCARRDDQIPNYKGIIDIFKNKYENNIMCAYFMGQKKRKRGVSDFLIKSGVDFVSIIEMEFCSKAQVVGSTIALDVAKLIFEEDISNFVFLTGDAYLVPTIEFLNRYDIKPFVHYFPLILSDHLKKGNCTLFRMGEGCFIYPRRKEDEQNKDGYERIHSAPPSR